MRPLFSTLLVVVVSLAAWAAAYASGPSPDNPCSCTFWNPTSSSAEVKALVIDLVAKDAVANSDMYFLKLVDKEGDVVHYVKLSIGKDGKGKVVYKFDDDVPASRLYMAVLFRPKVDVHMLDMKVVGKLADKSESVFFDHACEGVVVGPGGCVKMELW